MRRREFITGLGSAVVSIFSVRARSANKVPRIGLLDYAANEAGRQRLWDALRHRMRELGYTEGDTIAFESRWAEGNADRARTLAEDLVHLPVDVIVTASTPASQAAKRATSTIPIVMSSGADPVVVGLVASLNRPGGNVTGFSDITTDLIAKQVELLRGVIPQASRFAMIWEAGNGASQAGVKNATSAAQVLGISLQSLALHGADEFEGAFASMVREGVAAIIVGGSPVFFAERTRLIDLAARHRLPAMFNEQSYVRSGALMSYGADLAEGFRRGADYVDKILKGARPAELPVEQPTKFELAINLKTAKALGIAIPPNLLVQAEEVIE